MANTFFLLATYPECELSRNMWTKPKAWSWIEGLELWTQGGGIQRLKTIGRPGNSTEQAGAFFYPVFSHRLRRGSIRSLWERTKNSTIRAIAGDFDFESHEPHSRKPTEQTCYFWLTRRYFWPLYVPSLSQSDPSMYLTLIPKQREEKEDLTTTSFIITTSYNT